MKGWISQIYTKKSVFAKRTFSSLISKVAASAVGLSILVLILSFSVLRGFKGLVKDKMAGFSGHIQVLNSSSAINYEYEPFIYTDSIQDKLKNISGVVSVYPIAQKGGIAKSKSDLEGLVLKGIFKENDSAFYESILVQGRTPAFNSKGRSNEIVISSITATKLNVKLGDELKVFFFKEDRAKGFAPKIVGIFKTGAEEYDKLFALCSYQDIVSSVVSKSMYKKAVESSSNAITHLELKVSDFAKIQDINNEIRETLPYTLRSETIMSLQSQVFDWLTYLDKNIQIILILMALVAGINMVTAILILIVDNTRLIGLLKSIGAQHHSVVKLFLSLALNILAVGLLFGNLAAIVLIFLQQKFKFIKLDEANYYTNYVPVELKFTDLLWVNLGTIIICTLILVIPAQYISKISPVKALTFR